MKIEMMSIDNIFLTYILWKEYVASVNEKSEYFKITDERVKTFIYDHTTSLSDSNLLRLVVKNGRHVVGFMLGSFVTRVNEPKTVFFVDSLYCKNKELEPKLFGAVKEHIRKFGIKHIECNETVRNSLKDETFKEVLKLYSLEV